MSVSDNDYAGCFAFVFPISKVYLPIRPMEDWNYSRTVFGSPNCSSVEFFHLGSVSKAKSVGVPLVSWFPIRHCSVLKLILMEFVALSVNFGILSADWWWRLDLEAGVVLVGFHLIHINSKVWIIQPVINSLLLHLVSLRRLSALELECVKEVPVLVVEEAADDVSELCGLLSSELSLLLSSSCPVIGGNATLGDINKPWLDSTSILR